MSIQKFFDETKIIAPWLDPLNNQYFEKFYNLFENNLTEMTEFSFGLGFNNCGFLTKGITEETFPKIIQLLKLIEVNNENIKNIEKIKNIIKCNNILLKLEIDINNNPKFGIYFHEHISQLILKQIFNTLEIGQIEEDKITKIIKTLMLNKAMLGIGFSFSLEKFIKKLYFANSIRYSGNLIQKAILETMKNLNMPEGTILKFLENEILLETYTGSAVFTGLAFSDKILPAVSVDYEGVPLMKTRSILKNIDISEEKLNLLNHVFDALKLEKITYIGVKYFKGPAKTEPEIYIKRRFTDDPEITEIIDFFTKSKWRI